jgi:hypothetical protein
VSIRFSVVVPAYNAARTVEATVRSVLAQTERDLELVVVDDGSSDETADLVEAIARVDARVEVVRQANQGPAAARNTGIARARAPFVALLDNDDLWLPRYLEEMGAALAAAPDAAFAYCDAWVFVDGRLRVKRRTELGRRPAPTPGASWEEVVTTLARRNFVMSSVTARADALAESGGFDASVRGTDDYELWFRLLLGGRTAVRAGDAPLLLQRDRADSQSKDELMMQTSLLGVLEGVLSDDRLPPTARAVLERRVAAKVQAIERLRHPPPTRRLRNHAARIHRRLLDSRRFLAEAPPEVVEAFPEFGRSSSSRRPPISRR